MTRWTSSLALLSGLALSACAPAAEVALVRFPAPQALVSCADLPDGLSAELWVSGRQNACALTVEDDGAASGECEVAGRAVRTVTLDWYVMGGPGDEVRILLAQAQTQVDLSDTSTGEVEVGFSEDDITSRDCYDMRNDQVEGSPTMLYQGEQRLVCDLDEDCPDDTSEACSNLGELCAGGDPLL